MALFAVKKQEVSRLFGGVVALGEGTIVEFRASLGTLIGHQN